MGRGTGVERRGKGQLFAQGRAEPRAELGAATALGRTGNRALPQSCLQNVFPNTLDTSISLLELKKPAQVTGDTLSGPGSSISTSLGQAMFSPKIPIRKRNK